MELMDGRCVVIETGANLRSCRNIEQFAIAVDRELLSPSRTSRTSASGSRRTSSTRRC